MVAQLDKDAGACKRIRRDNGANEHGLVVGRSSYIVLDGRVGCDG